MLKALFKNKKLSDVQVSVILLDWSCRESFHSLDYLNDQTVPRDRYELIWIEYYGRRADEIDQRLAKARANGAAAPIDQWFVMGMPDELYYHKHLMYNLGIVHSRGEICVICDSDAMFSPDFIEAVIASFEQNPKIILHLDEVRNSDQLLYPFCHPDFGRIVAEGAINWKDGKTTGLWDTEDPLHSRNYGACMCARRADLIAIGGADEHLDYLGHVCGPYELTFRLVNHGRKEIWHQSQFLYHTWHPGQDGDFNYIGPNDGRHMSLTALEARETGRVKPWLENEAIRLLRTGTVTEPMQAAGKLLDPSYLEKWTKEAVAASENFSLWRRDQATTELVKELPGHNILSFGGVYYGIPHAVGAVDLTKAETRRDPALVTAETAEEVERLLLGEAEEPPQPELVGAVGAYNIIQFEGRFFGVPQAVGQVDFPSGAHLDHAEIIGDDSRLDLERRLKLMQIGTLELRTSARAGLLAIRESQARELDAEVRSLVDAIEEDQARIDELAERLSAENRQIDELEARIFDLHAELGKLGANFFVRVLRRLGG